MGIWEAILIAVSLCADCFACTFCSGVTLKRMTWKTVAGIALAFAVIQAGLLFLGWEFGNLFVGFIEKISHWVGFLLLLYLLLYFFFWFVVLFKILIVFHNCLFLPDLRQGKLFANGAGCDKMAYF